MGVTSSMQPSQFVMNNPDFLSLRSSDKPDCHHSSGRDGKNRRSTNESTVNDTDQSHGYHSKTATKLTAPGSSGVLLDKSSRKFQRLFNICEEEILVKSFNCALVDEILFQGRFYASVNYFCFYAKIANKRKLVKIGLGDICNVTKEKTAGIFPNAIGIHTKDSKFTFTSFMSRDATLRCLLHLIENFRTQKNQPLHWISGEDQHESSDDNDSIKMDLPAQPFVRKEDPENSSLDNAWEGRKPLSHRLKRSAPIKRKSNSSHSLMKRSAESSSYSLNSMKSTPGMSQKRSEPDTNSVSNCPHSNTNSERNSSRMSRMNQFQIFNRIPQFLHNNVTAQMCISIAYLVLVLMGIFTIVLAYRVHTFQLEYIQRVRMDDQLYMPHFKYKPFRHQIPECMYGKDAPVCSLVKQEELLHQRGMDKIHQTVIDSVNILDNLITNLRKHSLTVLNQIYPPPENM